MRCMVRMHRCIFKASSLCYNYSTVKWQRQVLSAIQPTGNIHLGNYLGAIKKWVDLQYSEENPVIFGIADLHSITVPQDPKELNNNILRLVATLLACGIDTKKSILFQQSTIPYHSHLCWILSTLTTMPKLSHLPQFKEKSKLFKDIPVGIFLYPVLQAADIMLYRATHIPVGKDQIQHLELANHLAHVFNNKYGKTFPRIEAIVDTSVGGIKSLIDPTKKMSKSDKSSKATITLMDTPDEIAKKCKKALTDSKSEVTYESEARPGITNLLLIHSGITGKTPEEIVQESSGINTAQYKEILADVIVEHLQPIRKKVLEYLDSPEYLIHQLQSGNEKASEIAEKTLKEVHFQIGLTRENWHILKTAVGQTP